MLKDPTVCILKTIYEYMGLLVFLMFFKNINLPKLTSQNQLFHEITRMKVWKFEQVHSWYQVLCYTSWIILYRLQNLFIPNISIYKYSIKEYPKSIGIEKWRGQIKKRELPVKMVIWADMTGLIAQPHQNYN